MVAFFCIIGMFCTGVIIAMILFEKNRAFKEWVYAWANSKDCDKIIVDDI
jgi:hypothetical protein